MLFTLLLFVCFVYVCTCNVVAACLFTCFSFFILMLLLYFCLFVDHVYKSIVFIFVAFVYYFNVKRCNTISICVTIHLNTIDSI